MTGYQSKKAAAQAKTIDEVNWADHEPDGRRAAAQDKLNTAIEPNTITFHNINADWVMRITADRRIEVNEDVEVTEAAQKVLDAMQYLLKAQRTWVGLTAKQAAECWTTSATQTWKNFEAKLKEKNT